MPAIKAKSAVPCNETVPKKKWKTGDRFFLHFADQNVSVFDENVTVLYAFNLVALLRNVR